MQPESVSSWRLLVESATANWPYGSTVKGTLLESMPLGGYHGDFSGGGARGYVGSCSRNSTRRWKSPPCR